MLGQQFSELESVLDSSILFKKKKKSQSSMFGILLKTFCKPPNKERGDKET